MFFVSSYTGRISYSEYVFVIKGGLARYRELVRPQKRSVLRTGYFKSDNLSSVTPTHNITFCSQIISRKGSGNYQFSQ